MGIEPTWDALQRPTPGLKPGSPTSELGASESVTYILILPVWQPFLALQYRLFA